MKIQEEIRKIHRGGDIIETAFGISEKDNVHILTILRDKLYTDKVLAVVREYTTNATDAHIMSGQGDRPIQVTIPNRFEEEFKVRDFGNGLTEEEVRTLYVKYGASTKRQTNDAIGQLGLGCKAGFAYGDSFMVTSYTQGIKKIYNAYIDETQIGMIALMHTEKTTDPDGVEITIPVKRKDIDAFGVRAQNVFNHFKVKPEVTGKVLQYPKPEWILDTPGWKISSTRYGNATAIMGDIGYEIDNSALDVDQGSKHYDLLNLECWINFDIGELSIAANREALEYTDDTKKKIFARLDKVRADIVTEVSNQVAAAPTYINAVSMYHKIVLSKGTYRYREFIKECVRQTPLKWKGIKLTERFGNNLQTDKDIDIRHATWCPTVYKKDITSHGEETIIRVDGAPVLLLEDDNNAGRWLIKAKKHIVDMIASGAIPAETRTVEVHLIKFNTPTARQSLRNEMHLPSDPVKLSEITFPIGHIKARTKNAKHQLSMFKFDTSKKYGVNSNFWTPQDIDVGGKGVYVEVFRFYWKLENKEEFIPQRIHDYINILKKLDVWKDSDVLYAVKTKDLDKLKDGDWVRLEDYFIDKVCTHLLASNTPQLLVNHESATNQAESNFFQQLTKHIGLINPESPLLDYHEAIRINYSANNQNSNIREFNDFMAKLKDIGKPLKEGFKPTVDPGEEKEKLYKLYPMFKYSDIMKRYYDDGMHNYHSFNTRFNETELKNTIDYINMVDAVRKGDKT